MGSMENVREENEMNIVIEILRVVFIMGAWVSAVLLAANHQPEAAGIFMCVGILADIQNEIVEARRTK